MMEAARTSETLVNFYQTTRRYNPEDSNLHTHRRENLKSYLVSSCFPNNIFEAFLISLALMMEAVSTSEMSVNFYKNTQRNIPEDSDLQFCKLVFLNLRQDCPFVFLFKLFTVSLSW
jgi:hypothetical protein